MVRIRCTPCRLATTFVSWSVGLTVTILSASTLAQPVFTPVELALGNPSRPTEVQVRETPSTIVVSVRRGSLNDQVELPAEHLTDVQIEPIVLRGGASIARVDIQAANHRFAVLATARGNRPVILWSGRLDPHGDPGERRREVLEVAERTGDGHLDVIVGTDLETSRICGRTSSLLHPRAVHPATLELEPVELRPFPLPPDLPELSTQLEPVLGLAPTPLLNGLVPASVSSSRGGPHDPSLIPPPVALTDGDPETSWIEGHPGSGRYEFATLRWTAAPQAIRALRFHLPRSASGPRALLLVTDGPEMLRVRLSSDREQWLALPEPLTTRCLSLVVDEVQPRAQHTGVAEITAYSDLDFRDWVPSLVRELGQGEHAAEFVRLVITHGLADQAVAGVLEAWPTLTPLGRRRAIQVLAASAETQEVARSGLLLAVRDEDETVRTEAFEALVSAGAVASPELRSLVSEPGELGERAAAALARIAPDDALGRIASALADDPNRAALRIALRVAAENASAAGVADIQRFLAEADVTTLGTIAVALASVPALQSMLVQRIEERAARAEEFADRWRLIHAAAELPASEAIDAWLTQLTAREEWMLRAAALTALVRRDSPNHRELARRLLQDEYPRMRVAAIEALATSEADFERVAERVDNDRWALVREAAILALRRDPRARPVIREAIDDPSRRVRARAIAVMTELGDTEAWPAVRERLDDDDEWPNVLAAAISYAGMRCHPDVIPAMRAVVERALRPNPWDADIGLAAEAVRVLVALGTPPAEEVIALAERPGAPAELVRTIQLARQRGNRCRR